MHNNMERPNPDKAKRLMPELSPELEADIISYVNSKRTPKMTQRAIRRMISRKFNERIKLDMAVYLQQKKAEVAATMIPQPPPASL